MTGIIACSYEPAWDDLSSKEVYDVFERGLYDKLHELVGFRNSVKLTDLVRNDRDAEFTITLTEKELRLLQFAIGVTTREFDKTIGLDMP